MPLANESSRRRSADPEQTRERVLDVFSERAKREGIRAVMMAELARELRMSASTLYRLFPSKEALASACVERWALELAGSEAAEAAPHEGHDPLERFSHWLDAWADVQGELSPAFTRDLRSDYPDAWARFDEVIQQRRRRGVELLRPILKPEIDEAVAFSILGLMLDAVLRPEFANRLRISRHEAIRSTFAIWASGAIDRRGQLHSIDN